MSYDRGTTTRRTERQLARIIDAIPRKPPRRVNPNHRASSRVETASVTPGEPNRAHRRREAHGASHWAGHLSRHEATCRARGERRRQRAHRRRMASR